MASALLSSVGSKTSQVLGFVRRWATSPSSSSDPRSSILEDLKKLERTLARILAVLHDAEEREIREESIKLWLRELRQVAQDADDVLDEYHYEELRAQVEGRASRKRKHVEGDDEEEVSGSLSTTVLIPDGMGDRIRKIREMFDEISLDRERLCLREEDGERRASGATYPAPSSHMVDESKIYGRGDDKDEVIDLLLSKGMANRFFVIPIVGKGGLGKTTIAQLVYNDSEVKKQFDLTGWVCVSDDFNVTRLTKDIIESILPSETTSTCGVTQLSKFQNILNEKVKGKRVLLVLDDVWNEQPSLWENLINPFVGAETVRIIVTCRNDSVAEIMQTVRPYRPSYLSQEQSWLLFKQHAFGAGNSEEQPSLVDIGKQIVKKCSGLPLALKTIGSLLRCMTNEVSWVDVLESDLWEVDKNNETIAALRLSYNRMPTHLKPCFIYCSMFPKDYEFEKDELVRLWMAQGYITPQGRRRPEDIGDEYFNDLQRRSFFDPFYDCYNGCHFFKMHDIIHDVAKFIAGNECCTVDDEKLGGLPKEVSHINLRSRGGMQSLSSCNSRGLRSLFARDTFYGRPVLLDDRLLSKPMIRCLRTLWFSWGYTKFSGSIGNLKHLRYLHIQSSSIKRLPESVCLLYHLQTLILECYYLSEFPDGLHKLINLRYLQVLNYSVKMSPYIPAGVEKLTNLQSLWGKFNVRGGEGHGGIGVQKNLVELQGTLCISGLRKLVKIEDARDANLKSKHRLEQLILEWNDLCYSPEGTSLHLAVSPENTKDAPSDEKMEEAILEYLQPHTNLKKLSIGSYCGSKFPKWMGDPFSLASLKEITIIGCDNVRSLPLYIHDSVGKLDMITPKGPLPSMLRKVCISDCRQLTSIKGLHNLHSLEGLDVCNCPQLQLISEEGLPIKLKHLRIVECQQLALLSGLQNLTSLIDLRITRCPRLQIMAEDKLSCMPNVVKIQDCPGLINWCQRQKINCIQMKCNSLDCGLSIILGIPFRDQRLSIEELTIWSCTSFSFVEHQDLMCFAPGHSLWHRLVIKDCPQLRLISEEGLPIKLKYLQIVECQQLALLSGLQNFTSLRDLHIRRCLRLRIMAEDKLSCMPNDVEIEDCPGLIDWCQIQKINCIQVVSPDKLILSNNWEIIKDEFSSIRTDEMQQPRSWVVHNSWNSFRDQRRSIEELTIWSCTSFSLVKCQNLVYVPGLAWQQRLVIKDCPDIEFLSDRLDIRSVCSLRVLQLPQYNLDWLKELQIVNCSKLTMVEGLSCLSSLKNLRIKGCPDLWLSRDDSLPFVPPCIEIEGVLRNEIYSPHLEEVEK